MLYYIVLEYSMYSIWIVLTITTAGAGSTTAATADAWIIAAAAAVT